MMTSITRITLNIRESEAFVECDISSAMDKLGLHNIPLVYICNYEGSKEEKIEAIKTILNSINLDNCVVVADAYVSTKEFPEEEYKSIDNIPVDEVLADGSKILEDLGFININDYVQYEYKVSFIYGNPLGIKVKEFVLNQNNHKN